MANLNQIQSHEVTQFGNSFQDSLMRRQQNQFSEFDGFRQPMAISNQKQTQRRDLGASGKDVSKYNNKNESQEAFNSDLSKFFTM